MRVVAASQKDLAIQMKAQQVAIWEEIAHNRNNHQQLIFNLDMVSTLSGSKIILLFDSVLSNCFERRAGEILVLSALVLFQGYVCEN